MTDPCHYPAPCGASCILSGNITHTIHACMDRHCLACHGGAVHAAAMLERRRAIAERAKALIRAEMAAHSEGLDDD